MTNKVVSIEFGLHDTMICEVDFKSKNPKVYKAFRFETPEATLEDGYILDALTLGNVLKDQMAKGKIRDKEVVFTIASSKIANREVTIPYVKEDKIPAVISAIAQDYFPVDISKYTLSYQLLEADKEGEERSMKLLLIAAPDDLIRSYVKFAGIAGLKIKALDYAGNSAMQLIQQQVGEGISLTIQMNEQTTMVEFIADGKQLVQRMIPYGTLGVIDAVAGNPIFGVKTRSEANQLLQKNRILLPGLDSEAAEDDYQEARQQVTEAMGYQINSIRRVIDYFHSLYPKMKLDHVYLVGNGTEIQGTVELFSTELERSVEALTSLKGVHISRQLVQKDVNFSSYLTVIGAAMKPVQFQSKEVAEKQRKRQSIQGIRIIFYGSILISICLIVISTVGLRTARQEKKSLEQKIALLEPVEATYIENKKVTEDEKAILALDLKSDSNNDQLGELIGQLEENLPTDMMVNSMTTDQNKVTLVIETKEKISVAQLLLNLHGISMLTNVSVPSIQKNESENGAKTYLFTVLADYAQSTDNQEQE